MKNHNMNMETRRLTAASKRLALLRVPIQAYPCRISGQVASGQASEHGTMDKH